MSGAAAGFCRLSGRSGSGASGGVSASAKIAGGGRRRGIRAVFWKALTVSAEELM